VPPLTKVSLTVACPFELVTVAPSAATGTTEIEHNLVRGAAPRLDCSCAIKWHHNVKGGEAVKFPR
jgi:hypothetical protein